MELHLDASAPFDGVCRLRGHAVEFEAAPEGWPVSGDGLTQFARKRDVIGIAPTGT
jgi:hypothetical protein